VDAPVGDSKLLPLRSAVDDPDTRPVVFVADADAVWPCSVPSGESEVPESLPVLPIEDVDWPDAVLESVLDSAGWLTG